jgi:hypothetical protein
MSRVPDSAGTCLAIDIPGDTANFADQKMNETGIKLEVNHQLDANSFEKSVQLIGG